MAQPIFGHTIPTNDGTGGATPPPPEMPTTGVAWNSVQNGIDLAGGYKRPDCLYNVATNILLKADPGTEPSDSAIAAEIKNLVGIYNGAAHKQGWQKINDNDDVTSEQLTNVISAFDAGPDT
jgi:hypothetical protein